MQWFWHILCDIEQKDKYTQTRSKKKLSCRQRCARKCRRYCCRRFRRCINKKIFGVPEPLADVDFDGMKSKLKLNATGSILNMFINAIQRKDSDISFKNDDADDIALSELKRKYSIKGSKEKVFKNMINDYKTRNLSLSKLQDSNLDVHNLDKNQIQNLLKDYETAQKERYADLNANDLKKRFDVRKSQQKVLNQMVNDLKKGKLSAAAISNARGFDHKHLNQDTLDNMLQKYQTRPSFVAKKFSIKGSKQKVLEDFIKDYRKGKWSATRMVSESGFNPNRLSKNELNNMLDKYAEEQQNKAMFSESKGRFHRLFKGFQSFQNNARRKVSDLINR